MIKSYLKLAWKVLLRRKFFTFISLFGIAFTLVVLLLVTALLDHVAGPYAPETHHDRMVGIYYAQMRGEHWRRNGFAGYGMLDAHARNLPNVERLAIASLPGGVFSFLNGQRIKSYLKRTDAAFWQVLDFTFLEGGPYTQADVDGHRMVAVINESTRQRFFGGQPALGRTIEADGQRFTVIGVVPDVPILRLVPFADIWVPVTTAKTDSYAREYVGNFMGILLLEDPAKIALTRDELWSRLRTAQLPEAGTHVSDVYEKLRHALRFEPGGRLAQLYPRANGAQVTSIHHQAIRQLGRGLAVDARAEPDGVIEAIRGTGPGFVLGVQWHPEFHAPGDDSVLDCTPILEEFLRAAGSPAWI